MEIYPSLISSDLLNLKKTMELLDPYVNGYHIDVMDDHFVPNLTWGPAFINAISKNTTKPLGVHLMVDNPAAWCERLSLKENDTFIFHYEAVKNNEQIRSIVEDVKSRKVKVGIALSPKTEIREILELLGDVDELLIMSVEPGFSGQKFIPEMLDKVKLAASFKKDKSLPFVISMDGGIGKENLQELSSLGVQRVAIAAGIFYKDDPLSALKELKSHNR